MEIQFSIEQVVKPNAVIEEVDLTPHKLANVLYERWWFTWVEPFRKTDHWPSMQVHADHIMEVYLRDVPKSMKPYDWYVWATSMFKGIKSLEESHPKANKYREQSDD